MSKFSCISLLKYPASLALALALATSANAVENTSAEEYILEASPEVSGNQERLLETDAAPVLSETSWPEESIGANEPSLEVPTETPIAQATTSDSSELIEQINQYNGDPNALDQVTDVRQLTDIDPFWFEAVEKMVNKYGCIVGYPDRTFKGRRNITRYEFAAAVSRCMEWVEVNIGTGNLSSEELERLRRLVREFEAELASLGTRVDDLEGRLAFVEDNQFSTTTKLQGEVVFSLADEFGTGTENQTVFSDRVRLLFVSSFTGKDGLYTRLDAGNTQLFQDPSGTELDQGAFTYTTNGTNDVGIGWLAYYFPIGDKINVYLPAAFPLWQDFVPTISPFFDDFTGAGGVLSSFAESSPIYKIGLAGGGGIGINFELADSLLLSTGYFGGNTFNPTENNGLFNGEYAALAQLTFTPSDRIQFAVTYVNAYFNRFDAATDSNAIFDTNVGTASNGTNPIGARQPFGTAAGVSAITNSYGIEGSIQLSDNIVFNAYGGFTDARQTSGATNVTTNSRDAQIWYYGGGFAFPDLGKEGNLAGLIAGAEPYVGGDDDTALHIEGFYKYQVNDYISITPGIIWLTAPQGESNRDDAIIGVIRTTFKF